MFFILKLKPTNDTQYANLLRLIHRVVGKLCMYNEGEVSSFLLQPLATYICILRRGITA